MAKKIDQKDTNYKAWYIDQLAKSEFFHQKLHEWKLVEIAEQLEAIQGENLTWARLALGISENAWNKVIHRGIKCYCFCTPRNSANYFRLNSLL
jgi:hypothetical protein